MWGNPAHLSEMARKIRSTRRKHSEEDSGLDDFHLLVATTNVDNYTYDGVDHGGERVADEVRPFDLRYRQFHARGFAVESTPPFLDRQGSGKN